MKKKKNTVILFDLDGTLIDSTEAILDSFEAAYRAHGLPLPKQEAILSKIGHPLSSMFRDLGVQKERIDDFVSAYKAHYAQISRDKTRLLPGAEEAVERASKFARLGVVTTKTGRYSVMLLEHLGLMEYFEVLVGSEDVTRHKPHPEPIERALSLMQRPKRGAWMVGDTPMDLQAAAAAGIGAYGVTCGYASPQTLARWSRNIAPDALEAVKAIAERESCV